MNCPTYHIPVLLHEAVDGLNCRPDGVYLDMTFGGGGHSREILRRLGADGHLYSFDQDADAEGNVPEGEERLTFVRSNFRYVTNWMRYYGLFGTLHSEASPRSASSSPAPLHLPPFLLWQASPLRDAERGGEAGQVDGVLADLGVSSHHFDAEERGFSFRYDAPLDMRMNGRGGQTAADVLNTYAEEDLARIFNIYGELKNGRKLAAAIVKARGQKTMVKIDDLLGVVRPFMPREREKKELAKVFQALRIEVNHEMEALEEMLRGAIRVLKPGGRLSVLTYHSLEDRMVKNFMKAGNIEGKVEQDFYGNRLAPLRQLGKVVTPSAKEQEENPRSRSAKLRIAEKL